jgi:hypothetical protein
LERDARVIDDASVRDRVRHLAARAGAKSVPAIAESASLRVPVAASVLAPAILLPRTWPTWSPARLDAVLVHELAHIVRRDLFIQRASLVYRALVWLSPLSWWLHRRLAELAEQASDDAALEAGAERTDYAETLLSFFSDVRQAAPIRVSTVAMARDAAAIAERRLDRILKWKGHAMKPTKRLVLALSIAAIPVAGLAAAARLSVTAAASVPTLEPAVVFEAIPPPSTPAVKASEQEHQTLPPPPPPPPPQRTIARAERTTPPPPPPPPPAQDAADDREFLQGAYPTDTPGLSTPALVRDVEAKYTSDAMRAKIQGDVNVQIVVSPNGTVTKARIAKDPPQNPLHDPNFQTVGFEGQVRQLEDQALAATRQFVFSPGMLDGKAVPVVANVLVAFRLH